VDPDKTTLTEAKNWLRAQLDEGARCPCCTQYAKLYKRKLNSGMAASLLAIFQRTRQLNPEGGWLHIPKDFESADKKLVTVLGNREYPKLRFWKLLEQDNKPNETADTPNSGRWRMTQLGEDFVLGEVTVPRHVFLYDGRVMRMSADETTDIRDALGDRFEYEELMGGV
jgi:hypothetical protein